MASSLLELTNWAWGLGLIVLTLAIHSIGVVAMALLFRGIRVRLEKRELEFRHWVPTLMCLIALAGLLLGVLHGIEAAIWAAAYWWLGAAESPLVAILYSLDAITTRGASGLRLDLHWRILGALEAVDGMLLFGISTAFLFAILQAYWPIIYQRR